MKAARQAALVEILERSDVHSQGDAVAHLAEAGFQATQATVSRDLDEIGAVRVRENGEIRYALADPASVFGMPLRRVLRDFVVARSASGPLAVLRTPPGHASVVAAALDRAHLDGVLGTVAGDDTLFVCGAEGTGGAGVLEILDRLEKS